MLLHLKKKGIEKQPILLSLIKKRGAINRLFSLFRNFNFVFLYYYIVPFFLSSIVHLSPQYILVSVYNKSEIVSHERREGNWYYNEKKKKGIKKVNPNFNTTKKVCFHFDLFPFHSIPRGNDTQLQREVKPV